MAFFGLSVLFLGFASLYAAKKEYDFRNSGDTNKTTGPKSDTLKSTGNPQTENGVNGFVGNHQQPIVQPNKTRQTLTRGGDPWQNRDLKPPQRKYKDPGIDWFPPGRQQVGTYDKRNPATDQTMITSLKSSQALSRAAAERPEIMPHPDQEPLLHPQPLSSFLNMVTHSNDGGIKSAGMRYDKKAQKFHDRSTTTVPTYVSPHEVHILSDNPSESHFWETQPNSDHGITINRHGPNLRHLVTQPVKTSRNGTVKTRERLRLAEINHRI